MLHSKTIINRIGGGNIIINGKSYSLNGKSMEILGDGQVYVENVKTKFYKGSNSVRGSGIGLALVDSIMTALDGTMDIKSTLGRGTVVTLGLPLYKNKKPFS